jgi:hypothetical protein
VRQDLEQVLDIKPRRLGHRRLGRGGNRVCHAGLSR